MDANNKQFNLTEELQGCTLDVLANGINSENSEQIALLLKTVITWKDKNVFRDNNLGVFLNVISTVCQTEPSTVLQLLINCTNELYLFYNLCAEEHQESNSCAHSEKTPNECRGPEWETFKEISNNPDDGSKTITTIKVNSNTKERVVLKTETIQRPNLEEVDKIFSGFLQSTVTSAEMDYISESNL